MPGPVDLAAVLAPIDQAWSPLTVAILDDYNLRVVHIRGEFTRHSHRRPTRCSWSSPAR